MADVGQVLSLLCNVGKHEEPVAIGRMPAADDLRTLQIEIGVVGNRNAACGVHDNILCLMQSRGALFHIHGRTGSIDGSVKIRIVVLAVVVAVGGIEQLDHVGRIAVIADPAVAGCLIVTGAAHRCEGCPFHDFDRNIDADLLPGFLQIFGNDLMIAGVIGRIGNLQIGIARLAS